MPSSLGHEISRPLDDVDDETREEMARDIRRSLAGHHGPSSCQCPAIEALGVLYDRGYRVVKA